MKFTDLKHAIGLWSLLAMAAVVMTQVTGFAFADSHCGHSGVDGGHKRIVGGDQSHRHQFPWIAYVTNIYRPNTELTSGLPEYYTTSCGGSLIGDGQWLVTAAHCLPRVSPFEGYHHNQTKVALGAYNVTKASETGRNVVRVPHNHIFVHEHYDGEANVNDIAMIWLGMNHRTDAHQIGPICLPTSDEAAVNRHECRIAGWGRVSTDGHDASVLKYADVSVLSADECHHFWPKHRFEREVCAGGHNHRTCRGDSGGPLQCRATEHEDRWVLVGVTAFSDTNCESNYPSAFTRVSHYLDWIDHIRHTHSH